MAGTGIFVLFRTMLVVTARLCIIRSRRRGLGWANIRPGLGIRATHLVPFAKWIGITTLKVPNVGTQVFGSEEQGMSLLNFEARVQSPWREIPARKSSTSMIELEEFDKDLGVRSVD